MLINAMGTLPLETIPSVNQLLSYGVAVKIANMGNCSGIFVFKAVIAHASLVMLEVILLIRGNVLLFLPVIRLTGAFIMS
jgi:hypothetical protein